MTLDEIFSRSNLFFSAYFRIPPERTKSVFVYQNDSQETETLHAVIFPSNGKNWKVIHKVLPPSGSLVLDTDEIIAEFNKDQITEGSIFACIEGLNFTSAETIKDFASSWASESGGSIFATGPFPELNMPATKAKRNFFMFAPIVARVGEVKSFNVIINHSSDSRYADTVELIPKLSNLLGETLVGNPVLIPPFGCVAVDIEDWFGENGMSILKQTDGYGGITIQHTGHNFTSYFFQADVHGNIVCGNHTQPPTGVFGAKMSSLQLFKGKIKETFPFLMYLRKEPGH